jgi:ketosteroid isomerase-like protein
MSNGVDDIRRVFDAFAGGDARALFDVIDEEAVWRVPGSTQVAREYRGRAEIFELFKLTRKLTNGTYSSELLDARCVDDHATAVYRARGERLGRKLDLEQSLEITLRNGRWYEIEAVPSNPEVFEAFWGD